MGIGIPELLGITVEGAPPKNCSLAAKLYAGYENVSHFVLSPQLSFQVPVVADGPARRAASHALCSKQNRTLNVIN